MPEQPPPASFTTDPSTTHFAVSLQTYLSKHASPDFSYIATSALVIDTSQPSTPRVLLLQRAQGDSMPGLWEAPGGGCDDEDESILHGVARELWEETGLEAKVIGPQIGDPHLFVSRSGKRICRFSFMVEVEKEGMSNVRLDSKEHQKFVWATEDEIRMKKVGNVGLDFAGDRMEDVVLAAFAHAEGQNT